MQKNIISGKLVTTVLLLSICFAGFTNISTLIILKKNGINSKTISYLDARVNYTAHNAYDILNAYTDKGREIITTYTYRLDFIIPLLFSTALALLIKYLLLKIHFNHKHLNLLLAVPIAAGIFDWLENISITVILNDFTKDAVFRITPYTRIFTCIKYTFTLLSLSIILIGTIILIINVVKAKRTTLSG